MVGKNWVWEEAGSVSPKGIRKVKVIPIKSLKSFSVTQTYSNLKKAILLEEYSWGEHGEILEYVKRLLQNATRKAA